VARPVVLIADDDAILRGLLARAIGDELAVDVRVARDGREALARARERRPAVVLVDVMMPELDGLEVTRRLRADPTAAGVYVVVMTASGLTAEAVRGAGADAFLPKPFDLADALAAVAGALAGPPPLPVH
jgi:CheY-like chemotaxis protein